MYQVRTYICSIQFSGLLTTTVKVHTCSDRARRRVRHALGTLDDPLVCKHGINFCGISNVPNDGIRNSRLLFNHVSTTRCIEASQYLCLPPSSPSPHSMAHIRSASFVTLFCASVALGALIPPEGAPTHRTELMQPLTLLFRNAH